MIFLKAYFVVVMIIVAMAVALSITSCEPERIATPHFGSCEPAVVAACDTVWSQ